MNDIELSYNVNPFLNAMKKITQSFDKFQDKGTESINKVEKKTNSLSSFMIAKGQIMASAIMAGFGKLREIVGKEIPEIGTTFDIAGKIISRNLLWPLRQELIPLLQKFLNWVRDHRNMFVQWGMVIKNIFIVIKTGFMAAWHIVEAFAKGFMSVILKTFGLTGKSITDIINLLLFKITFLFAFIGAKLTPLAEFLGKTIGGIIDFIVKLGKAFAEGFGKAFDFEKIGKLFDALARLADTLTKSNAAKIIKEFLINLAGGIGSVIGVLTSGAVDTLTAFVDTLDKLLNLKFDKVGQGIIDWIGDFAKETAGLFTGNSIQKQFDENMKKIDKYKKGLDKKTLNAFNTKYGAFTSVTGQERAIKNESIHDGIVKSDGTVIHTDPKDTIIATKNGINRSSSNNTNMNNQAIKIGDININVTEGNAKQAGVNFANGMMEHVYRGLQKQWILAGNV